VLDLSYGSFRTSVKFAANSLCYTIMQEMPFPIYN
jgi:hypothetical protein